MNDDSNLTAPMRVGGKKAATKKMLLVVGLIGIIAFAIITRMFFELGNNINDNNAVKGSEGIYPFAAMFLTILALIGGLIWSVKFWHLIDEGAQRAHLDAFYWGGSISWVVIAPCMILPLKVNGFEFAVITKLDMNTSQVFALGIFATIVFTLLGYGVAWLIWWAKRL